MRISGQSGFSWIILALELITDKNGNGNGGSLKRELREPRESERRGSESNSLSVIR